MTFLASGYSPLGATARHSTVPGIHTYRTNDTLAVVKADGYFNEIKGRLGQLDWLYVCTEESTSPKFAFIIIQTDGVNVGLERVNLIAAGGLGYTLGDVVDVPMTKAMLNGLFVIRRPVLTVSGIGTGGAVQSTLFKDYGSFKTTTLGGVQAGDLNGVATEVIEAAGTPDNGLTINVNIQSLNITMYPDDIIAV